MTARGRAAFHAAAPVYVAEIERQFSAALTNAELEQLASLLDRILAQRASASALVT